MRFRRVSIDGYGRFTGRTVDFVPGLQIVIGPNEQGKSTLRSFICDMLYGQKRSLTLRAYDESNELHVPWNNPDCYGGSLVYSLDGGHDIEVVRNFDRRRESVQVFNRTLGRDITEDYERFRNREVDFASAHLGLSKAVFLGAATISHFSLEELGDQEALNQIRERLLALADSGSDSSSSEAALRRLQDRIAAIGQPMARTKPLPLARQRLAQLQQEYEQALALQGELSCMMEQRRSILDDIERLREDRKSLEDELGVLEAYENAVRLQEAEALQARINTATQQSFALGGAREFPVELTPEAQRAENLVNTAQVQLERTQGEKETLEQQIRQEQQHAAAGALAEQDAPQEAEQQLTDAAAAIQAIDQRISDTEALLDAAQSKWDEAQAALNRLPDFSRISSDPVEWFTQLSSSFALAVRDRDEERTVRDRLRAEMRQRVDASAPSAAIFKDCANFPELAREYELGKRVAEEQRTQRAHHMRQLETLQEEIAERAPAFFWLTLFCGAFLAALLGTYAYFGKSAILYAVAVVGLALFYFFTSLLQSRGRLAILAKQIGDAKAGGDAPAPAAAGVDSPVEALLVRAGVESIRELEAMYEQYREAAVDISARRRVLDEHEARTKDAEERIPRLLMRVREAFEMAGEPVQTENDVAMAAKGAIERYQTYRETKRQVNECRAFHEKQQGELKKLAQARQAAREALDAAEASVREILREYGFGEESAYGTAAAALKAYRQRVSQLREQRGRASLLKEKFAQLEQRLRLETMDLERRRQDLTSILAKGGVQSIEHWRAMAEQARQYRELRERRAAMEAQLKALLRGQMIRDLRLLVESAGETSAPPSKTREELRDALIMLSNAIDARIREEHALHLAATERAAGMRSVNEIEEEKEAVARQLDLLDMELEASSHAMSLIEAIASDKHARIAPRLASLASEYLAEITGDAYHELLISREMDVSVRIPQTNRFDSTPEKSLSKGTVDQIYLALRLAFVQSLSVNNETIPMLLDDPFANYDNSRLERTMHLLARMGAQTQMLLFTCREDVAAAGKKAGAHVISL